MAAQLLIDCAPLPVELTVTSCARNEPVRRFFHELTGAAAGELAVLGEAAWPTHVARDEGS
jgi:hypothetical protein